MTLGERAGSGLKEMSKGQAFGSDVGRAWV